MNCGDCKYCQCGFIKSKLDNDYRCKLMKRKPCYDPTINNFSVHDNVPTWCPIK